MVAEAPVTVAPEPETRRRPPDKLRPIGIAAAIGLVLYFLGAGVTVARARAYSHLVFPLIYMAPAVASLALL